MRAIVLASCALLTFACGGDPAERYDAFMKRADRSPPDLPDSSAMGAFADIGDEEYLLNIALNPLGDLALRLRLLITRFEVSDGGAEAAVSGEFRFEEESRTDPAAAAFDTTLGADGRMIISTGRVVVPANRSPVPNTEVETEFSLKTTVLDEKSLCGVIDDDASQVLRPIVLSLKGTTFGAKAFGPAGEKPTDVPNACP